MKVNTDDLISTRQIAERIGVVVAAVSNWKRRDEAFPRPVWTDGRTSLYLRWQVDAWLEHTGRSTTGEDES